MEPMSSVLAGGFLTTGPPGKTVAGLSRLSPVTLLCEVEGDGGGFPLSMRFSRQGYWSGLLFPSLGDLPNPGIEPGSPALQADSLLTELQGKPNKHKVRPRSPNMST